MPNLRTTAIAVSLLTLACAAHLRADAAEDYCTASTGKVVFRQATYNTNGGTPLPLAQTKQFCEYTSKSDGSQIDVLLDTLVTTKPTLAVLAYYAKEPLNSGCEGNPASCYCSQLGGSDLFGGINAAGGGWVNNNLPDATLEACIFPDMSSIDSWGLAYYANGIIRGIDLTKVLRYTPPAGDAK
jgi:hypothetical protein